MPEAYVVDAVRTPVGRRKGGLGGEHPADLGAHPIRNLVERTGVDPAAIEDVVYGCLDNVGGQAGDIARTCALVAGLPEHVPGVTVDRQCGSSQQAISFAAQAVLSGTSDLVVAGGVQNMTRYPLMAGWKAGAEYGDPDPWSTSPGWRARYGDAEISQFRAAEMIAEKWGISREDMEAFALESHRRALAAIDAGHFDREVVAYGDVTTDEGPRRDTSAEKMAGLQPLSPGGNVTAAVSSQISDGAAAVLIASEQAVRDHGLTPRARIHHVSTRGADPTWVLTAPIPATEHALKRTGLAIGDIDVVEINEAFASVVQAWLQETGADPARVNPNGGAIALGHPLGASGARLFCTLLGELERTGGRYGLQTMCEGGGQANVTVIERL
ncbi:MULTISPECIES: acetyl-CoA C-acetyltransferase [unclassified Pseudonocardia]|uniref:acetyl-CoA C-acetyltransferase n=1 Tax=unclassified Pseudonocardia TaxID=2619320 RepID=UPI0001FFDDF7|nr:acetyl-CoA C-acetyltransferase [Pseudonocardia sp. Ae707_Ps1]OLM16773.1 3-ketoacyl-CoA thiolase, Acetyl-CoA acetyltransferase [Pseudonocardia sp. Ae707_Ps1]